VAALPPDGTPHKIKTTRSRSTAVVLAGSVLVETHDEWQVSDRRYLSESSMALLDKTTEQPKEVAGQPLLTA
jgi:hypothetical protein